MMWILAFLACELSIRLQKGVPCISLNCSSMIQESSEGRVKIQGVTRNPTVVTFLQTDTWLMASGPDAWNWYRRAESDEMTVDNALPVWKFHQIKVLLLETCHNFCWRKFMTETITGSGRCWLGLETPLLPQSQGLWNVPGWFWSVWYSTSNWIKVTDRLHNCIENLTVFSEFKHKLSVGDNYRKHASSFLFLCWIFCGNSLRQTDSCKEEGWPRFFACLPSLLRQYLAAILNATNIKGLVRSIFPSEFKGTIKIPKKIKSKMKFTVAIVFLIVGIFAMTEVSEAQEVICQILLRLCVLPTQVDIEKIIINNWFFTLYTDS